MVDEVSDYSVMIRWITNQTAMRVTNEIKMIETCETEMITNKTETFTRVTNTMEIFWRAANEIKMVMWVVNEAETLEKIRDENEIIRVIIKAEHHCFTSLRSLERLCWLSLTVQLPLIKGVFYRLVTWI